jgi:hypothetical protein
MVRIRITKREYAIIFGVSFLMISIGVFGWLYIGIDILIILVIFLTVLILVSLMEFNHRVSESFKNQQNLFISVQKSLEDQQDQNYRQIESLFSIFFTLKPRIPLPETRGWAASPDLLKKITEEIFYRKPNYIVEMGSGVSTIVIAYCLKQLGKGRVVSFEHDDKYADINNRLIKYYDLENVANIILAPLKEIVIKDGTWLWYDKDSMIFEQPIDFLIIDGPPGDIQKLSRYPTLPLLYRHLSSRSTIILDDGLREDEKKIVALWENEYENIYSEYLNFEKGAFIIHKESMKENL